MGKSKIEATNSSNMMTLASGALNALSFSKIFGKAGAGIKGKIIKFLTTGSVEAATEWAEEPAEALILGKDILQAMKQGTLVIPAVFLVGGLAGAGISGIKQTKEFSKEEIPTEPTKPTEEGIETDTDRLKRGVETTREEVRQARLFKNVIPEEGKGTGKKFEPVLEQAIASREIKSTELKPEELKTATENVSSLDFKAGVPISQKPRTRALTTKQLAKQSKQGLFVNKLDGEDFYSDGSMLIKGIPDGKDIKISIAKPNFKEVVPIATLEEIKPVGYQVVDNISIVWFDNRQPIQVKYYDYIKKKYPDVIFKSTGGGENVIKLYNKDEFVGLIMSITPPAVVPHGILKMFKTEAK